MRFEWHCGLVLELEYKWLISASELGHNTEENSRWMTAHIFGDGERTMLITAARRDTGCAIVRDGLEKTWTDEEEGGSLMGKIRDTWGWP